MTLTTDASRFSIRQAGLLGLCLLLLLLTGCEPQDIKVTVDPYYEGATMQIDVIYCESSAEAIQWMRKDIDQYFTPGDTDREKVVAASRVLSLYFNVDEMNLKARSDVYTIDFGSELENVIRKDNPIMKVWGLDERNQRKDSAHLIILADLPGLHARQQGPGSRRAWIPLIPRDPDTGFVYFPDIGLFKEVKNVAGVDATIKRNSNIEISIFDKKDNRVTPKIPPIQ